MHIRKKERKNEKGKAKEIHKREKTRTQHKTQQRKNKRLIPKTFKNVCTIDIMYCQDHPSNLQRYPVIRNKEILTHLYYSQYAGYMARRLTVYSLNSSLLSVIHIK